MQSTIPAGIAEFLLVARLGSFSKAALQLNCSRARMPQIISALEKQVGVQLLHRSTRSLSLTAAGEVFFERSSRGVEQLEFAVESARDAQQAITGVIRINSVGGFFGERIIAPLLTRFMQRYPGIKLNLSFSSVRVDLIDEQYDLVLRMGPMEDSSLIARKLCVYNNYLVASPSYLSEAPALHSPSDLSKHALINGSIASWQFVHPSSGKKAEVSIESVLQCANGFVALRAAVAGLGISRQPSYYLQRELNQGSLVVLMEQWQLLPTTLSLVYPKSRYAQPRIQALVEYLLTADYQG